MDSLDIVTTGRSDLYRCRYVYVIIKNQRGIIPLNKIMGLS